MQFAIIFVFLMTFMTMILQWKDETRNGSQ